MHMMKTTIHLGLFLIAPLINFNVLAEETLDSVMARSKIDYQKLIRRQGKARFLKEVVEGMNLTNTNAGGVRRIDEVMTVGFPNTIVGNSILTTSEISKSALVNQAKLSHIPYQEYEKKYFETSKSQLRSALCSLNAFQAMFEEGINYSVLFIFESGEVAYNFTLTKGACNG